MREFIKLYVVEMLLGCPMLIIRIPRDQKTRGIVRFVAEQLKKGNMLGEIARSSTYVYLYVPDEALSVAFAYMIYLRAKKEGLSVESLYSIPADLERILPEDVKRIGEKWSSGKYLKKAKRDTMLLKNKFITPEVMEVLLG
ncbi:MAG: hypothetical protein QW290_08030 [Sulfolobales archaeon]